MLRETSSPNIDLFFRARDTQCGMASVPTFQVSGEEEPGESQRVKAAGGGRSLLSVPAPVRSSIGINNPDKAGPGSGLFPLPSSPQVAGSATGNPRNKVALAPGCSLMDWVRLTKSGKDLSGVGGPMVKGKPREVTRQVSEIGSRLSRYLLVFLFGIMIFTVQGTSRTGGISFLSLYLYGIMLAF